jgi:hypothetical protein
VSYYIIFGIVMAMCFIGMRFNSWVSLGIESRDKEKLLDLNTRDHFYQFQKLDKLIDFYDTLDIKERIICVSFGFGLFLFATLYGLYWYSKHQIYLYRQSK